MTTGPANPAPPPNPGPTSPTTPPPGSHFHRLVHWTGWPAVTSLITAGAAVFALIFTNLTLRETTAQNVTARQVAISERFSKATEQLGSDKVNSRLSGIYLLEKLAKDSPVDQGPIVEVLAAYVRDSRAKCDENLITVKGFRPAVDVQAALTVLGRMPRGGTAIDLSGACLPGVQLHNTNMANVDFTGASLVHSSFVDVDLSGAIFDRAILMGAQFDRANLSGSSWVLASFFAARLGSSPVADAKFHHAKLRGADLTGLSGLTLDLFRPGPQWIPGKPGDEPVAYCDESTRWPEGFAPPRCEKEQF